MLPIIASSFGLVVGPNGAHVPNFTRSLNSADIRTFQTTPAHHTDGKFHTTAAHHPAGSKCYAKQRDPTCLLAPGFASENYGGVERLSDRAAKAALPIDYAPAGYLDRTAMGTGCAEHHGCYLDYDDDEPKADDEPAGMVVPTEDTDARKAAIKAKRDQLLAEAAQLLAEADALDDPPPTQTTADEQPVYA